MMDCPHHWSLHNDRLVRTVTCPLRTEDDAKLRGCEPYNCTVAYPWANKACTQRRARISPGHSAEAMQFEKTKSTQHALQNPDYIVNEACDAHKQAHTETAPQAYKKNGIYAWRLDLPTRCQTGEEKASS